MIEVIRNVPEAPHFRSFIPHPKTGFSKNQNRIPMNNPMVQLYTKIVF